MNNNSFEKTGILARFIMRRDRVRLPVWILSFAVLSMIVAGTFTDLYASVEERQAIAETMKNPAMTVLFGEAYGMDDYTAGPMMAHQMLLLTAIVVGIMNILFVARHTRTSEEDGQIELIRALPTGRLSQLSATLLMSTVVNIVLALAVGFGLYALQIESIDLGGSLLYGAALGTVGIFFAAVTAVFAQVVESSRNAIALSFSVLGIAYIIRAIGDVSSEFVAWFSPLGWMLRTEVFVNNYWWPLFLTIGVGLIFVVLSFYLHGIRDIGAGLFPAKRGKSTAHTFLLHPFGLALRLQRTGIIAWLIGMYVLGMTYGSVLGDLEAFLSDSELMQQLLQSSAGASITEQYITMLMSVMAMMSVIPAVMVLLKLKGEEMKNRTENLFSRAVSRLKVFGSYVGLAHLVGFFALLVSAVGLWLAGLAVMDDMMSLGTILQAALVYVPAMWVMISLATLFIGFAPSTVYVTWIYLGYAFVVSYFGGMLQLPTWLEKISPFAHIPEVISEDMTYGSLVVLTMISLIISWSGFILYKKRDLLG